VRSPELPGLYLLVFLSSFSKGETHHLDPGGVFEVFVADDKFYRVG
jgi:hypothetical protein